MMFERRYHAIFCNASAACCETNWNISTAQTMGKAKGKMPLSFSSEDERHNYRGIL
ncbi:hypothetical protein PITCH_A1920033 [uncultured Desulfobacterium sp.]|uniref:Uncharacterized protein n=1 Tax=uncultured Desulfobacterium sp. TaxID=201089 RepID=A0A445MVX2_9BACT|nr:hypothetical protein PITCH_A1920033 [uncultured Desulfobacterium sp.]